jgi:hypothetical protein
MTYDGVLLQSLARGLEFMQNISSIVYSPRQHLVPIETKALRDLLSRGVYQDRAHGSRATAWGHPFRQLIGAIFLSQYTGIRELAVKKPLDDEPSTQFSLGIFTFPDPNDLKAGRHVFRNLIKLDLTVSLDKPGARGNYTCVFSNPNVPAPRWLGPHWIFHQKHTYEIDAAASKHDEMSPGSSEFMLSFAMRTRLVRQCSRHVRPHLPGWATYLLSSRSLANVAEAEIVEPRGHIC